MSHQEIQRARYSAEILIAIRVAGFPSGDVRLRSRHQENQKAAIHVTIARPTVFVVRPNMIQEVSMRVCHKTLRRHGESLPVSNLDPAAIAQGVREIVHDLHQTLRKTTPSPGELIELERAH